MSEFQISWAELTAEGKLDSNITGICHSIMRNMQAL